MKSTFNKYIYIGFILFGLMSGTLNGYASSLFYVVSYMFMTLVSFAVLMMMSRKNFECETLEDFKGLNKKSSICKPIE